MNDDTRQRTFTESTLASLARAGSHSARPWRGLDLGDAQARSFGDYELLELLGEGGMGVVYRAHQRSLDREVAIKFIAADLAQDPQMAERLRQEAQAAARLQHPHIVPVFEIGQVEQLHYFTMPLLPGANLEQRLARSAVSVTEVLALLRKLAAAVAHAHEQRLLHLDLKPANILFDAHDQPQIGDFGLARRLDALGGVSVAEVSGTPAYMAPEQVQIQRHRLSPATDVYALGAIAYRLLGGRSPHGIGSAEQLMDSAVRGQWPPLRSLAPSVPRDLAAICEHCLMLDPAQRYPSAVELAADLERYAQGLPISLRPPGRIESVIRLLRRQPQWVGVVSAGGLVLLAATAAFSYWRGQVEAQARQQQQDTVIATMQFMKRGTLPPGEYGDYEVEDGFCGRRRAQGVMEVFACPPEVRFLQTGEAMAHYFSRNGRCYRQRQRQPDGRYDYVEPFDCPADGIKPDTSSTTARFFVAGDRCYRSFVRVYGTRFEYRDEFVCPPEVRAIAGTAPASPTPPVDPDP